MNIHKQIIELIARFIPFFLLKKVYNSNIFPFYHTVSDSVLPHVKHLYKARNVKQFIADLDFITQNFEINNPINFENNDKHSFILSFDDGLSEIYNIIAPILEKKNIPAIFFINSAFVDNKELFYKHKISLIIDELLKDENKKSILKNNMPFVNNKYLKKLNFYDNEEIEKIASLLNIDFQNYLKTKKPYLTLKQINELEKRGFIFGAHSKNHIKYNLLSIEEQILQTCSSLKFIEDKTKSKYKLFAFPFTDFGVENKFFEKIYSENIADYTFGTAGIKIDVFEKNYQRIPIENHKSAKNSIKFEYLYFFLKKIAGKNTIIRS